MAIKKRGKTQYLYKRVPKRYAAVEPRQFVWVSLHTDSEALAATKEVTAWANMVEGWEALLAGDSSDAETRFAAARELASARGFRFMKVADVAKLERDELLTRIEAVPQTRSGPNLIEAAAILGGAVEPEITVSKALELYWTLAKDKTFGKSEDQLRRWKNPRVKAVNNFVDLIGDKALARITGDDMLDFRNWWMERIELEDLTANSGNKDLVHLGDIFKTVNRLKRLGLVLPLSDLAIKEGEQRQRPPFSVEWIKEKILAPGALGGLNTEARCIVLGMVNTGYRPSEGAGLLSAHINLAARVPHISIEPVGRQLKSKHAKRVIPLTGVSLEAFRECPDGFPRYRDNPSLSATVNKFMRENGLMETPGHTLYSLRHAFEDRMLAAGVDERIRRDLFGHALGRERYGQGATLEHLQQVVQTIAL
ncbi:tyrosine-type recombinase/integrase [Cypionkella psychrotolerans]|uniref:tyrosine-type recombinase/integrase n=1 Tax=Cypionkella psychrotolerans TaxID=1678131 RepID=UPI0006B657E9|nr:tyrosine-type recombinase/integrase [Cypionkella psychrotolerans]